MKMIFCDWGTTNFRAFLLEYGKVIDCFSSDNGLLKAREIGFTNILESTFAYFNLPIETPVRLSGMVGSKHGWKEAPYAETPVSIESMNQNFAQIHNFPDVKILGGISHQLSNGKYDVMRGEEVQVFGVLDKYPQAKIICLPGTHSKWVKCDNGKIKEFSTWMTGDFFKSFSENTIFREQISNQKFDEASFRKGLFYAMGAGPLLNSIFHLRTDYLFSRIGSEEFHSYLSGYIIGSEVKEAAKDVQEIYLCGSEEMMSLYSLVLESFNKKTIKISASEASVTGISRLMGDAVYG